MHHVTFEAESIYGTSGTLAPKGDRLETLL